MMVELTLLQSRDGLEVRRDETSAAGRGSATDRVDGWSTGPDVSWWDREPGTDAWWAEVAPRVERWTAGKEVRGDVDQLALALTRVLLPRPAHDRLVEIRSGLRTHERLVVYVKFDARLDERWVRSPWELVHLNGRPLVGPGVRMVRSVEAETASTPLGGGNLSTLVAIGPRRIPGGGWAPPTDADATVRSQLNHVDGAELAAPLQPVTMDELKRALADFTADEPLDLLVFDGHGEQTGLYFAGPHDGLAVAVQTDDLAELIGGRVRVAVLVACRAGGSPVEPSSWMGVAEALARRGTTTVGFATPVDAYMAADFVRGFVARLRAGEAVDAALGYARSALSDGAAQARAVVWQAGTEPVHLRPPAAAPPVGPPTDVVDNRFGGDGWFQARPGLIANLSAEISSGARIVEIIGPPGAGKSSVLRWWYETGGGSELPKPSCALLRDPLLAQADPLAGDVLCQRVAAAAAARTGRDREVTNALAQLRFTDDRSLWRSLMLHELEQLSESQRAEPFLVLVDELDQAEESFVSFLAEAITTSPPWVQWVCVSRPDMPVLPGVRNPRGIARVALSQHTDTEAATRYAYRLLVPLQERGRLDAAGRQRLATAIGERAEGVFLWVRTICDLLEAQLDDSPLPAGPDVVEGLRLPAAASGSAMGVLYEEAIRPAVVRDPLVRTVLGILAACRDPRGFTSGEIAALVERRASDVDVVVRSRWIRPFVPGADGRWRLSHQSLKDWINAELLGLTGLGEVETSVGLGLDRLRREGRLGDMHGYTQRYLVDHLVAGVERLKLHHPDQPALVDALTDVVQDDLWLVDGALTLGPGTVAADLSRVHRWIDPVVLGERHEVFVQAAKLARLGTGSAASLLTSLYTKAVQWDEPKLFHTLADRLTGIGRPWWRVCFRVGPNHRAGEVVFTRHDARVTDVAWHPTRHLVASSDANGNVFVWNTDDPDNPKPLAHNDSVYTVVWSHDGTRLATASDDGPARIWNPNDPANPITLPHSGVVKAVAWSHDDTRLATVSDDGTARIWDPDDPANPTTLPHRRVSAVAWSHDDTRLATAHDDRTARIWDPDDPANPITLPHRGMVQKVVWSHDDTRLATASRGTARIWDLNDPDNPITLPHNRQVTAVAWNSSDTRLATASRRDPVRIWNPHNPQEPATLPHRGAVTSVAWSHDGSRLATASGDGTACIWDLNDLGKPANLPHDGLNAVAWSHDDTCLATASDDGTICVWNAHNPSYRLTLHHSHRVNAVSWSHDDTRLATAHEEGAVRIWDPNDPANPITLPHRRRVKAVAWSHDDTRLATASRGTARIWNPHTPTARPITLPHNHRVNAVAWSYEDTRLATASSDSVRIWDPADPDNPVKLPYSRQVIAVAWNHHNTHLAAASYDATARIWDPDDPDNPIYLPHDRRVTAVAWNHCYTHLATASGDSVLIWEPDDPDNPVYLPHGSRVIAVAWNHNDNQLATASRNTVRIWDPDDPYHPITLPHDAEVTAVTWSHNDGRLATAGVDGTLLIWELGWSPSVISS